MFFLGLQAPVPIFCWALRMIRDWISPVTELRLSLQRIVEGCCPATRRKAPGLVDGVQQFGGQSVSNRFGVSSYVYVYIVHF